jgi:A/G-specific adenine glycosylase
MTPDPTALLAWYDRHARKLPWRVGPRERARGVQPDPYRVWLSEVMLQQTTVAVVKSYFETFVSRWPTVAALAAAPREEVMKAWAGLGYYARARNLHACAVEVATKHGGRFPEASAGLLDLPGIGAYTAAAIAAIAFDEPAPVVDGNIERVIARLFAIATPLPEAKPTIREHQARLTPRQRAGDYAQAMMDLGASLCTPKRPACSLCPLNADCAAHAAGNEELFPIRAAKPERPTRVGAAFVAVRDDGAILLRHRGDEGLLGGMAEVPGTKWASSPAVSGNAELTVDAPFDAAWERLDRSVIHVFTHFRLELAVFRAHVSSPCRPPPECWWAPPQSLPGEALPSVMKKAIEAAVPGATRQAKRRGGPEARLGQNDKGIR